MPLYKNCSITYSIFVLTMATFFIKGSISNELGTEILQFFIRCVFPVIDNNLLLPSTAIELYKEVKEMNYQEYFYCPTCIEITNDKCCDNCEKECKRFFFLNLEDWLMSQYEFGKFDTLIKNLSTGTSGQYTDFNDGDEFVRLDRIFKIEYVTDLVLYFLLTFDGGQHFKKSTRYFGQCCCTF